MSSKKRLKVAHVYTKYGTVYQPYLHRLGQELEKHNVELRVFSRVEPDSPAEDCKVLRFRGSSRGLRNDALLAARHVLTIAESVLKKPVWNGDDIRSRLVRWADLLPLVEEDFDVIHLVNWPMFRLLLPFLEARKSKFVLSFRGYETLFGIDENDAWKQDIQEVWKRASALHFVSNFLAEEARRRGAPPDKSMVIRPGVDVDWFQPSSRPDDSGACRIVTVCRLTWEKALEVGLLVAKKLIARGLPVEYHIVGGGILEKPLKYWSDALGIRSRVIWHGAAGTELVRDILNACDIYLQPSVSESFGVAVVEAMAMGCPVVASRVEGIPEICIDGETGFLVEFGDVEGMACAIERLWQKKELRKSMGNRARQRAVDEFSVEREAREWLALYEAVFRGELENRRAQIA